jgi:hypothetical protein
VATKSDFSAEEWQVLEFAMLDTMMYMSLVDPGFWASFKEAGAVARFLAGRRQNSPSDLVRDLAGDIHARRDQEVVAHPANMEAPILARIEAAVALIAKKAPEDAAAFRDLIVGVANSAAGAVDGTTEHEREAIERIEAALG